MRGNKKTYISLFSSAGVGCYGFKMEGFSCIATNEILERRLNIQKANNKCKYDSGYICGDITNSEIKKKLFEEISYWKQNEKIDKVDVIMATPPCQGMSTANYKKSNEIQRNSLVLEAMKIIDEVKPRIFIFENVKAFLKTECVDQDGNRNTIGDSINIFLGQDYNIYSKVVNFKDYGVPSSRPRTLVVGVLKSEKNITPLNIFPLKENQITVKDAIGKLMPLNYGERDKEDLLHSFRTYPKYMREWIHDLREGETAFNNPKDKLPYKIVDGKRKLLKSGHMGNKFRRMFWDSPAPCITTRNDQLASQTTIHPNDDRVLSLRELMRVMTIPDTFNWVEPSNLSIETIDNNETLIRQSIGEAVPTHVINVMAKNISTMLDYDCYLKNYCNNSKNEKYSGNNFYIKSFLYEMNIENTKSSGSFYTPQSVVYNTIKEFKPEDNVKLLEPSVGMGAFIPQMLRLIDDCKSVEITCVDSSEECLINFKSLLKKQRLNKKFKFKFINEDFLLWKTNDYYDAVIANPPYFNMSSKQKSMYKKDFDFVNNNIYCLFLKKLSKLASELMVVIPKSFLMIPDSNDVRDLLSSNYDIVSIYDYGVHYFKDVFIEIISMHFSNCYYGDIYIKNCNDNEERNVPQGYIYHDKAWLLYRDDWFDEYYKTLKVNVFDFYRDRQLTNKYLSDVKKKIWVVKSKNVQDNGDIIHKDGYDRYVDNLEGFTLKRYFNEKPIIFTNFTYNTRAAILPDECTINGSLCMLFPKENIENIDLSLYSSEQFRKYYSIVKNKSKFTINVDNNVIHYIGIKKNA